jgi:hypothetical protein
MQRLTYPTCGACHYVEGEHGGAYVAGNLYGAAGDYHLVTYFQGRAACTPPFAATSSAFCSGSVPNLDPSGLRDAWVAKVGRVALTPGCHH